VKKPFSPCLAFLFTALALACSTAGCRPAAVILPPHIKSVAVDTVENLTSTYGLEARLTQSTVLQFQQDGRLAVTGPGQSDLSVKIVVKKYLKECILTDTATNRPTQYRLSITYDLTGKDQVDKKTLLEAAGLTQSVLYYTPDFTGAIAETEDQALSRLAEDLSRTVARRVIQGN
jgi:hypothetical protein